MLSPGTSWPSTPELRDRKNSDRELLLVDCRPCGRAGAGQQCPLHGQTVHIPQPEEAVPRQTLQCGHRWMWSSTAAGALGRLVELSHHGSEASSEPVPLLMSKDSSQHSIHPTQCGLAHRAEGDRAWCSQGAHQTLCHPPLLAQEGQSPQQIHFSFPTGIPGAT